MIDSISALYRIYLGEVYEVDQEMDPSCLRLVVGPTVRKQHDHGSFMRPQRNKEPYSAHGPATLDTDGSPWEL